MKWFVIWRAGYDQMRDEFGMPVGALDYEYPMVNNEPKAALSTWREFLESGEKEK